MSAAATASPVFALDCESEARRIGSWLRAQVVEMHRRGLVLGLSGGVDSAVCAALAVRAVGAGKVHALLMPERDSSSTSLERGREVARRLGIGHTVEDLTRTLEAVGCYRRRDEAIRAVFPAYGEGWKSKITISGGREGAFNYFRLVVQDPDGRTLDERLPLREYLQVVAATSFKQRARKALEYYHADRLNYAVLGTPNRLEYDQGFFVKNGDGAADVKPIAHLYKTQVYALAAHLGVPEEIRTAPPTTDTYSLAQGQDEFFFALPWAQMDVALWARDQGLPAADLARRLGMDEARAEFVYRDIVAKRAAARYLHAPPSTLGPAVEG